jgi:hypothetical protein
MDTVIRDKLNKVFGSFIEEITPDAISVRYLANRPYAHPTTPTVGVSSCAHYSVHWNIEVVRCRQVAMLKGRMTLENLSFKPSCCEELGLPVLLNAGSIGSLVIEIPRTLGGLKSSPLKVTIQDVLLSVRPNPATDLKRTQLDKHMFEWEQLEQADADVDPSSQMGMILAKVQDNLVIHVQNVHLRFEDTLSCQPSWRNESHPNRCFSLGLTLDHLTIEGCLIDPQSGEWETGAEGGSLRFLNKKITIGSPRDVRWSPPEEADDRGGRPRGTKALSCNPSGLGVYLNHSERPLPTADLSVWKEEMRSYIAHTNTHTGNEWLLEPIAATCRLSFDKNATSTACTSRIWQEEAAIQHDFKARADGRRMSVTQHGNGRKMSVTQHGTTPRPQGRARASTVGLYSSPVEASTRAKQTARDLSRGPHDFAKVSTAPHFSAGCYHWQCPG